MAPRGMTIRAVLATVFVTFPRAAHRARKFAELGVTRLIHAPRYNDGAEFRRSAETLAKSVRETLTNARPL